MITVFKIAIKILTDCVKTTLNLFLNKHNKINMVEHWKNHG